MSLRVRQVFIEKLLGNSRPLSVEVRRSASAPRACLRVIVFFVFLYRGCRALSLLHRRATFFSYHDRTATGETDEEEGAA